VSLKAIVSQRLVHDVNGDIIPAVELMQNTKHVQELIKKARSTRSRTRWSRASRRIADLSSSRCSILPGGPYHARGSAVERRLGHEPSLAHQQCQESAAAAARRNGAAASPTRGISNSQEDLSSIKLNLDALG
jgi:hypothetical protein